MLEYGLPEKPTPITQRSFRHRSWGASFGCAEDFGRVASLSGLMSRASLGLHTGSALPACS